MWSLLMTASSVIGAQYFIFKLNCRSHVTRNLFIFTFFCKKNHHDALTSILWRTQATVVERPVYCSVWMGWWSVEWSMIRQRVCVFRQHTTHAIAWGPVVQGGDVLINRSQAVFRQRFGTTCSGTVPNSVRCMQNNYNAESEVQFIFLY